MNPSATGIDHVAARVKLAGREWQGMSPEKKREAPYKPAYKGFDEDLTRRSQETADRAQEVQAGKGEYVDAAYLEEGAEEYRRRTGDEPPDIEAKRARKR